MIDRPPFHPLPFRTESRRPILHPRWLHLDDTSGQSHFSIWSLQQRIAGDLTGYYIVYLRRHRNRVPRPYYVASFWREREKSLSNRMILTSHTNTGGNIFALADPYTITADGERRSSIAMNLSKK